MKQIQIPEELFLDLVKYHLLGDTSEICQKAIEEGLELKVNKIAKRATYSSYKTSDTAEEREKARKNYLDLIGMGEEFRY